MRKRGWGITGGIIIILVIVLWGLYRKNHPPIQSQTRFLMDTYCTIQVPGNLEVLTAIEQAFNRVEEIDVKFNALNPGSPIYDFNNNNVPITDEEIITLVQTAIQVSKKTGGKYDITIFPLIDLWGFFSESPALPREEEINKLLKVIGYESLSVENGNLIKKKGETKIDLGSIAKGYAIGEAKKELERAGIESGLIDAGGDIYALGTNSGKPWKIGIRNPRGDGIIGVLELSDMSVVTSGDYERCFENDGMRYHHILDPETGYPVKGMASVTVISPDPILADAWSTAFFVLGKEKFLEVIDSLNSIEAFMVTDEGEKIHSSGVNIQVFER